MGIAIDPAAVRPDQADWEPNTAHTLTTGIYIARTPIGIANVDQTGLHASAGSESRLDQDK